MADRRRAHCKRCRQHRSKVGPISWEGNCRPCGKVEMNSNVDQMHGKRGPNFNAWRRGMILSAGGRVDDPKLLV